MYYTTAHVLYDMGECYETVYIVSCTAKVLVTPDMGGGEVYLKERCGVQPTAERLGFSKESSLHTDIPLSSLSGSHLHGASPQIPQGNYQPIGEGDSISIDSYTMAMESGG